MEVLGVHPAGRPAPPPARLAALLKLANSWSQLEELRVAAGSTSTGCHDCRKHAMSSLAVYVRAEMYVALLAQRAPGP